MVNTVYGFGDYRFIRPPKDVITPPQLLRTGPDGRETEIVRVSFSPRLSRLLAFLLENYSRPAVNLEAVKYVWGQRATPLRNYEASWTELVERLRDVFDDTTRPYRYIQRVDGRIQFVYRPITVTEENCDSLISNSSRPVPNHQADGRYTIEPAESEEDIRWAAALAAKVYENPLDRIPENVMLDWYRTNRNGFSILRSKGQRVGNLDILPLRPAPLEQFIRGDLYERDIKPEHLYGPIDSEKIVDLYVESFVCKSSLAVPILLSEFTELASRLCNPLRLRNIYALAASDEGVNLVSDLGFRVVGIAQDHDLYCCQYSDLSSELGAVALTFRQLLEGRLRRLGQSERPTAL